MIPLVPYTLQQAMLSIFVPYCTSIIFGPGLIIVTKMSFSAASLPCRWCRRWARSVAPLAPGAGSRSTLPSSVARAARRVVWRATCVSRASNGDAVMCTDSLGSATRRRLLCRVNYVVCTAYGHANGNAKAGVTIAQGTRGAARIGPADRVRERQGGGPDVLLNPNPLRRRFILHLSQKRSSV